MENNRNEEFKVPRRNKEKETQYKELDTAEIQTKMRTKRGAEIWFQLDNETEELEGKVTKVRKPTGKDKMLDAG